MMKRNLLVIPVLLLSSLLTACNDIPNCTDKKVKERVEFLLKDRNYPYNIKSQISIDNGYDYRDLLFYLPAIEFNLAPTLSYEISNIATLQRDKNVDSYFCEAQVSAKVDLNKLDSMKPYLSKVLSEQQRKRAKGYPQALRRFENTSGYPYTKENMEKDIEYTQQQIFELEERLKENKDNEYIKHDLEYARKRIDEYKKMYEESPEIVRKKTEQLKNYYGLNRNIEEEVNHLLTKEEQNLTSLYWDFPIRYVIQKVDDGKDFRVTLK